MLIRNLAAGVVAHRLHETILRQIFSPKTCGSIQHGRVEKIFTAGIAIVQAGAYCVNQSMVFGFKHVQGSLIPFLWISPYVLHHLHPCAETLSPAEEQKVEKINVAVRSNSDHAAHETHSVLIVVLPKHVLSGANVTPHTVSAVRGGVSKYHADLSGQRTARPQLIQNFKLLEGCITSERVLVQGYF